MLRTPLRALLLHSGTTKGPVLHWARTGPLRRMSGAAAAAQRTAVVAIDGPAASGKGTLSKRLAQTLGFAHMDTGLLYRRVGAAALAQGVPLDDDPALAAIASDLPPLSEASAHTLRSEAVGQAASRVSAIPSVRAALLEAQRAFARHPPPPAAGAVLDGRDVGTVVCPDATAKLFVTASVEVRARRRLLELQEAAAAALGSHRSQTHSDAAAAAVGAAAAGAAAAGASAVGAAPPGPTFEGVLEAMRERDARDAGRAAAPLVAAPDALVLDTTQMTIEEALAAALAHARACIAEAAAADGEGG